MGKKSKMVNEDPILKKNFKYQKRKKEREQQKVRMRKEKQDEQKRMKELKAIQKGINQNIEKIYEEEKRKLINSANKTKSIAKSVFLGAKNNFIKNVQTEVQSQQNKIEEQMIKNLPKYSLEDSENGYTQHFESQLTQKTKGFLIKQKKVTQTMKVQQQVKKQIQAMFSVKKLGDANQMVNQSQKNQLKKSDDVYAKALQEQEKQQEPFIIDRKHKIEKQLKIANHIYSVSNLTLESCSNLIKSSPSQKIMTQQSQQSQYSIASGFINNYIDYIHIENKQEQTIEQFRNIVINHMHEHQKQCIRSLVQSKKSKGFTNAKYLIITPYVGDAKAIFDTIEDTFMVDQEDNLGQPLAVNQDTKVNKKKRRANLEWVVENKQKIQENEDDEDDFFRVGIKVLPRKKKIVYFSNFDASDIIVASPIGLKSIINGESGKKQTSFLSSVQILYLDRASVIMMQNWDHLIDIFSNLNEMIKYESLKNSINDIRPSYLDQMGRIYRQNIVFSQFSFPQLIALKINHFHNWQGCATLKQIFRPLSIEKQGKIEKQFYKIEIKQPKDDLQVRFEYFKRKFWDKIHNSDQDKKILIFVNSYFEFVKLKSFLEKVNASFQAISEHTAKQKIQSRMSRFNNEEYRILLLTQRAYYFGLCQIKRQKQIYFYSLPKNSFIFKDLIENIELDEDNEAKVISIYSKYDKFIVERLAGTQKALEMVREYCTSVSFIIN